MGSRSSRTLLHADSLAVWAAPGYLLFAREGALLAQKFDAARMDALAPWAAERSSISKLGSVTTPTTDP
jgi:hypothetical protein